MAERRLLMEDPRVAQPYISRSYLAPERDPGNQEKAAALTLLGELLGGSSTSVLNQRLQFDQKLVVQTGAWYSGTSVDDGTFNFFVVPAAGVTLQQAEDAMDAVLTEFLETGVDEAQLDRLKMQLRAARIYSSDDVSAIANRYGRALAVGLTVEDVQAWPDILEATTPKQIMQAAREVLVDSNSVTGWLTAPEVTQ